MNRHAKFLFLILLHAPLVASSQLKGKVIAVADGDTFTMLMGNQEIRVRLHGIDCPERNQDFGNVAKKFLADYVYNKTVSVQEKGIDRYGRTIGIVIVDNININEKLLQVGLAWHYKRYDNNSAWAIMENNAKEKKLGLWAHATPIPPWDFRKLKPVN